MEMQAHTPCFIHKKKQATESQQLAYQYNELQPKVPVLSETSGNGYSPIPKRSGDRPTAFERLPA